MANESEIISIFRSAGASLEPVAMRDGGPKLALGLMGVTLFVLVKTTNGTMTRDQKKWADAWRGSFVVVRSPDDAMNLVRLIRAGEYDVNQQRRERRR